MSKVGDILDEIENLDKQYKVINNILNKMSEKQEIADYLFQNVGVDRDSLREIAATLATRGSHLTEQLRESDVNID